jgi:hypothetical protein
MQQSGAQRRPAGIDTKRGSTIMIQMMMATLGGSPAARGAQRQQTLRRAFDARKAAGFAIVASGWAVLVAQALQHTLGG